MVVELEDLDNLRIDLRVVLGQVAKQALSATKESPLVALRSDNLKRKSAIVMRRVSTVVTTYLL